MKLSPEGVAKRFPEQYPDDALQVLRAMSLTDGKGVKLLGSMSIRSQQYAGDYDAYEIVHLHESSVEKALDVLVARFQDVIKTLRGMSNVFIGDCKAGVIEEWRVIPRDAKLVDGEIVGFDLVGARAVVDRLVKDNIISRTEGWDAHALLKNTMTPFDFLVAKQTLKFHIVRWTPKEILAGHTTLRNGASYTLQDAFHSPAIVKLDTIALVNNSRYTDFSMIYEFHNNNTILNPEPIHIETSLKESILYYARTNNPFKVLKRVFALARYKGQNNIVELLTPILNSDLGRIYLLSSDTGTLISLLGDNPKFPRSKLQEELDQFKGRMANIYALPEFVNQDRKLYDMLNVILRSPSTKSLLPKLSAFKDALDDILAKGTHQIMKHLRLSQYLPTK